MIYVSEKKVKELGGMENTMTGDKLIAQ